MSVTAFVCLLSVSLSVCGAPPNSCANQKMLYTIISHTLLFRINEGSQISIGVRHIPKNDKRRVLNIDRGKPKVLKTGTKQKIFQKSS